MRIAFVTGVFPKLSETFVLNQITGLIDRGHDLEIFAEESGGDDKVHDDVARYELRERTTYWSRPKWWQRNPDYGDFDVIYCHFGHVAEFARQQRARGAIRAPGLVAVFHAYDITVLLRERSKAFYDDLFAEADLLLPISHLWANRLQTLGASPAAIKVHRMGIDPERFAYSARCPPTDGPVHVVSVARLVEKKGIAYVVEALGELKRSHPALDFRYHIVGDGPLRAELTELVQRHDLDEEVIFEGWMTRDEVGAVMQRAHLFVVPSVTAANGDMEGLPVVLMEAMAQGLPVIASRHSGIPEIVAHEHSGLLVEERDAAGLAAALGQMIHHPEQWEPMGRRGRAIVEEHFAIEPLNDRLEHLLTQVITS